MDCAHQAALSMGFPRQGYWSTLPFSSAGDLPNPGVDWQADSLPLNPHGNPIQSLCKKYLELYL